MSYTGTRIILATVTPKPGALNRITELYQPIIEHAKAYEDGCIEFQLFTEVNPQTGVEELFTIERFKNLEALLAHQKTEALVNFTKVSKEEDLLAQPLGIKVVKAISGFVV